MLRSLAPPSPPSPHSSLRPPAGRIVYEWDQTLDEVTLYVPLPPGVPSKLFECIITKGHLTLGIKGNPPYLNVSHPPPLSPPIYINGPSPL